MKDFRLAVKCFIMNDGKLLILERHSKDDFKPKIWELPGGQLEPGEDPFGGAKREVMEETGIDIDIIHPMRIIHFTRNSGRIITMIVFLCRALGTDVKISEEHNRFDWIPLENSKEKLGDFFHPDVDVFYKMDMQRNL